MTIERWLAAQDTDFVTWSARKRAAGRARLRERLDRIAEGDTQLCKAGMAPTVANLFLSKQTTEGVGLGYQDTRQQQQVDGPVQILIVGSVESQQLVRGLAGKVIDVPAQAALSAGDKQTISAPSSSPQLRSVAESDGEAT